MKSVKATLIYFILIAVGAVVSAIFSISIPRHPSTAVLWGLSGARLLLLAFFLVCLCSCIYLIFQVKTKKSTPKFIGSLSTSDLLVNDLIFLIFISLTTVSFFALFFPTDRILQYQAILQRLRPLFLFAALVFLQTTLLLLLIQGRLSWQKFQQKMQKHTKLMVPFCIMLGVFFIILLWIAFTQYGISPSNFWEKNGVPLLFSQGLFAVLVVSWLYLCTRLLNRRFPDGLLRRIFESDRKKEFLIFLGLWIISAIVWVSEPLPYNAFNPGPFPPNNQFYPYSDAAYYYSYTQWARIGQPLQLVDKPLYSAFLFLLRFFTSSEFNPIIMLQTVIFAVLPALVYLVTKKIAGRFAGLLAALLMIFQVRNSIAASLFLWKVSQPKMIMSEFPLGILLALLCFVLLRFLLKAGNGAQFVILSAGVFGLSTLVRHNVWLFLPFLLLLFLFYRRKVDRRWWQNILIFILALVVTISPWSWRSQQVTNSPFYFLIPFKGTVLEKRYKPSLDESSIQNTAAGFENVEEMGASKLASPTVLPRVAPVQQITSLLAQMQNHFFHNLAANAFILPTALDARSLEQTVINHPTPGLWDYVWDGRLTSGAKFMLYLNLALLALGVSTAWKKHKFTGLLPLFFFLLYNLSTAAALTSGGRYIVPTIWVVVLYYSIGISALLFGWKHLFGFSSQCRRTEQFVAKKKTIKMHSNWSSMILWLILFFIIGALPVIFERLYPPEFTGQQMPALLDQLVEEDLLDDAGLSYSAVEDFLKGEEGARLSIGRALYPRFFNFQDDESLELFRFIPKDKPTFTFQFMGPAYALTTVQMGESPAYFPNEATVIVLGCLYEKENVDIYIDYHFDAYAVWLMDEGGTIFYQPDEIIDLECGQ